jgi:hypothetical protein
VVVRALRSRRREHEQGRGQEEEVEEGWGRATGSLGVCQGHDTEANPAEVIERVRNNLSAAEARWENEGGAIGRRSEGRKTK